MDTFLVTVHRIIVRTVQSRYIGVPSLALGACVFYDPAIGDWDLHTPITSRERERPDLLEHLAQGGPVFLSYLWQVREYE